MNGTTAAHALAANTQSHLIRLAGHLKASDRPLATTGAAPGDGDIPVAGLVCVLCGQTVEDWRALFGQHKIWLP